MKQRQNQPGLFMQPTPGTDCGLQSDDLNGQLFYETKPTEAVKNAVSIRQEHEALKARLGVAYSYYAERLIQGK